MAHVKFQTRDQEIVWCAAFSRTPTLVWIKEWKKSGRLRIIHSDWIERTKALGFEVIA